MQLRAQHQREVISAENALKQTDYRCLECAGKVRLRSGPQRTPHFFHLSGAKGCSLKEKSLEHIQTQLYIQHLLPKDECYLEQPFPQICRIADVCWEARKIIFEVQRSPISIDEVVARNQDYARAGYHVIWILHDVRHFNRRRLSDAEHFLRSEQSYFTNIDRHGNGCIYDQFEWLSHNTRHRQSAPLNVNLAKQHKYLGKRHENAPQLIKNRMKSGHYFHGDLLDLYLKNPSLLHFQNTPVQKKEPQLMRLYKRGLRVLMRLSQ